VSDRTRDPIYRMLRAFGDVTRRLVEQRETCVDARLEIGRVRETINLGLRIPTPTGWPTVTTGVPFGFGFFGSSSSPLTAAIRSARDAITARP
jgi:hypothetical protein